MANYLGKPAMPRLERGNPLAAGMRACFMLSQRGDMRDVASNYNGLIVGSPTWGSGPYGTQLGGFSTTNYAKIDGVATAGLGQVLPFWIASFAINSSSTGFAFPVSCGNFANGTPILGLAYNLSGTANALSFYTRDATGHGAAGSSFTTTQASDGNPHVMMGVQWSTSTASLYWDGAQVAAWTGGGGNFTPLAMDLFSLGLLRRSTLADPFGGNLIAAAVGWGSVPDPKKFSDDWLSGRFSVMRPPPKLSLYAAIAGGAVVQGPSAFPDGLVGGPSASYAF